MNRWLFLCGMVLLGLILFLWTCGDDDDDDDDSGGGGGDCIICSSTSECTDALGVGWVCVGGCCQDMGGQDDDDAAEDDDAGDDDDDADEHGLTWISITGDYFHMGCVDNDFDCQADEQPDHVVQVADFQITETEITQSQFFDAVGAMPSANAGCNLCPVEQVTWDQASNFCTSVGGRLPTEAEWEYAARGGSEAIYPCGDSPSCMEYEAWYSENAEDRTHEVAQKDPNGYGLYDMMGNAFEWVSDWYDSDYYEDSPRENPSGPTGGDAKVLRGGSYAADAWGLRASYRYSAAPGGAFRLYGFRCVKGGANAQNPEEEK